MVLGCELLELCFFIGFVFVYFGETKAPEERLVLLSLFGLVAVTM